ncbi:hypothetical protein C8R44DRAFT_729078 [Mycena epipterygia]|nr:hypothetical protein C8R44DRAFT_729078 [Mycena epipterygia]
MKFYSILDTDLHARPVVPAAYGWVQRILDRLRGLVGSTHRKCGYISRRRVPRRKPNTFELPWGRRLAPSTVGIIGGEHGSRARPDAVPNRDVLGTLGLDEGRPAGPSAQLSTRTRSQMLPGFILPPSFWPTFLIIYPDLKAKGAGPVKPAPGAGRTFAFELLNFIRSKLQPDQVFEAILGLFLRCNIQS